MDVNYIIIKLAFYWPSIFLKSENPSKAFEIVAISSSLSTSKLKESKQDLFTNGFPTWSHKNSKR